MGASAWPWSGTRGLTARLPPRTRTVHNDQIQGDAAALEVGAAVKAQKNRPGTVEDYYNIDKEHQLGSGQYAIAYKCTSKKDPSTEEAVKIIKRSGYTGVPEREMEEVILLQAIQHPQCLGVDEVFQTASEVQIVQELMSIDLMHYLMERGPGSKTWLTEAEAGGCFHMICEGVAYLHAHQIGHRDLKPENILIKKKGDLMSVKIADSGFAKYHPEGDEHLTSTGLGTFGYVAPEIIERKARYDGLLVDLWSLGVICFILVAGEAPFGLGDSSKSGKDKVLNGTYKFGTIWEKKSVYPKEVVKKLLKVNPKERMSAQQCLENNWVANNGVFNAAWHYSPGGVPAAATVVPTAKPAARTTAAKGGAEKGADEPGCEGCSMM